MLQEEYGEVAGLFPFEQEAETGPSFFRPQPDEADVSSPLLEDKTMDNRPPPVETSPTDPGREGQYPSCIGHPLVAAW